MKTLVPAAFLFLILTIPSISYSQGNEASKILAALIGDSTIDLPEQFECDKSITIQLSTEDGNIVDKAQNFVLHFASGRQFMVMAPVESHQTNHQEYSELVIDFVKMQMITFLETAGAKIAVVRPIEDSLLSDKNSINQKYADLKKTGNTKSILGHLAREFIFDSDDSAGTIWIVLNLDLKIPKSFTPLGLQINSTNSLSNDLIKKGTVVEISSTEKSSGEQTKMTLTGMNLSDPFTINIKGYIPTKLPQAPDEKVFE